MSYNKRKFILLAFLGIVITLIGYQTAIDAQNTANTALNMTCTPIINNTDLAPFKGDGERVSGDTYYANDTPRHVYIILVNPTPSTDVDIDFYINGTRVQDDDLRTTIVNQNFSKYFNVPLGASYMANISTSNYQWIEYKQLCNRPGVLTITNVFANNTTFVPYTGATNNVDITPFTINASGFNAFGDSDFNRFNISNIRNIIGEHLHIITNASVDDYFNTFSAGNSTNISSIRVSSNATTIASMEQCNGGCHARNISWIRVWSSFIDVSSPNVYFTGNATFSGNVVANNVNSSYYREFWQKQGTVVQGSWSWFTQVSQTDYASVTGEGGGYWTNYNNTFNSNLDEYKWDNIFLTSGTYKITVVYQSAGNRGIAEFLFGSTSLGTVDMYSAGNVFNVISTVTFAVSSPTTADLRFRANGKNVASSGNVIMFSRLRVEKIG